MSAGSSSMPPAWAPSPTELVSSPAPCPQTGSTQPNTSTAFTCPRSSRPAQCLFQVVAAFAAIVAVVFLVSECLVWRIRVPATSKLVRRRLASGKGDANKGSPREESICEDLKDADEGADGASFDESLRVTHSVASQGGRRARAQPRSERARGKTLATLRILKGLFAKVEEHEEQKPEEAVSHGSSPKDSPGASSSAPEDEEDVEEDRKGPGKPDYLLEMFMEHARRGATAIKRQKAHAEALQPSSRATIIPSATPAGAQHLESPPPLKRHRGSNSEGVLVAALQKAMHPEGLTERKGTLARMTTLGKDSLIAAEVVEEHSSSGGSISQRLDEILVGQTGPCSDVPGEDDAEAAQFLDAYLEEVLEVESSSLLADWILQPSAGIPFAEAEAHGESYTASKSLKEGDLMPLMDSPAPLQSSDAAVDPSLFWPIHTQVNVRERTGKKSTNQRNADASGSPSRGVSTWSGKQGPSSAGPAFASSAPLYSISLDATVDAYQAHPWCKLPETPPGRYPIPEYITYRGGWGGEATFAQALELARRTLAKPVLNESDVVGLWTSGAALIRYASRYLCHPLESKWSAQLVKPLASRFLCAYYLLGISRVLGPEWGAQMWWPTLMGKLLANPNRWRYIGGIPGSNSKKNILVQSFLDAFAAFRSGLCPEARHIVWVMRQIFCSPSIMTEFQSAEWDGWREADEDFVRSQQASEQRNSDDYK
ncbi:hypothetical protein Esti_006796 [Eimeria stiedai]